MEHNIMMVVSAHTSIFIVFHPVKDDKAWFPYNITN
jgi:hypothetical protein